MNDDETPAEFMGRIIPGSKTFSVKQLCPVCGWHFAFGMTDPTGATTELVDGAALICSHCCKPLVMREGKLHALTIDEIRAMDADMQQQLKHGWLLATLARMVAPEPTKGPMQ